MGRPSRPAWQVNEAKQHIFNAALELFNRQGYKEVSVRKIARRAGCSPATIYNFYRDKDALYLDLLNRGFEILLGRIEEASGAGGPIELRRSFAGIFFCFSRDYPNYYDIMFIYPVTKYFNYVGASSERAVWAEKLVALKSFRLLREAAAAASGPGWICRSWRGSCWPWLTAVLPCTAPESGPSWLPTTNSSITLRWTATCKI